MIGFHAILLLSCFCVVLGIVPPYVQSNNAFTYAKDYVSENLPSRSLDIHKLEDRQQFSFAMLVGVTAGLVLANHESADYMPLEVLYEYVPFSWTNYKGISTTGQKILDDASQKISLISDLIGSLCGSETVTECNAKVDESIKEAPYVYKLSANLLLSLGKVASVIKVNELNFNAIIQANHDMPYLIHNVETINFREFVALLDDAYVKLNEIKLGRFYNVKDNHKHSQAKAVVGRLPSRKSDAALKKRD